MDSLTAGRALRDSQLALFEQRDTAFLSRCRTLAIEIARRQGTVCINDIRAQMRLPAEIHPSVLGSVFRTKQFKKVGYVEATHKAAHARVVGVYAFVNEGEQHVSKRNCTQECFAGVEGAQLPIFSDYK